MCESDSKFRHPYRIGLIFMSDWINFYVGSDFPFFPRSDQIRININIYNIYKLF